jgi:glycosyltransferase involved in cell wall biosynthesis
MGSLLQWQPQKYKIYLYIWAMKKEWIVDVIIPAYNEALSIGSVLEDLPWAKIRKVVVCDNNSQDDTAHVAKSKGAHVVYESEMGYGAACLKAMDYIAEEAGESPDIIVFLDADYSDSPAELELLLNPILKGGFDLVIGSRVLGKAEPGALLPHQRFGNQLATTLIRWIYGTSFTDLGPFRAIRYPALLALDMRDRNYGWTVEMQVKAAQLGLKCTEVPVSYKRRIGISKVSGTIKGSVLAGIKILYIVLRSWA